MINFNPIRGTQEFINNTPIVDGQFLFVTDQATGKNSIYIDVGTTRIAIGAFNWDYILNKPFSSIGSNLTVDLNGVLSADIQTWNQITSKPFSTIGIGLEVDENDALNANISWADVDTKPFDTIGSNLTVDNNGVLSANIQTWNQITSKPFTTIGSNLTVDNNGVLSANIQTWNQIATKPFTGIGTGLEVINGQLCATGGGTGVDWSTEVINKPFETLGSSFTVNSNGVLNLSSINWNVITNKPFNTIGNGLSVDSNQALIANITWSSVSSKPFISIGNGLTVTTVGSDDILSADIYNVASSNVGTPTATTIKNQVITINNSNIPISGTIYMEYTQNIDVGLTTYTFEHELIQSTSIIDVCTSEWGLVPSSVEIMANQGGTGYVCKVNFIETTAINSVTCRIYIK